MSLSTALVPSVYIYVYYVFGCFTFWGMSKVYGSLASNENLK